MPPSGLVPSALCEHHLHRHVPGRGGDLCRPLGVKGDGGICGALAGDKLTRLLTNGQTEVFLRVLIAVVIVMNIYNSIRFLSAV